MRYIRKLAWLWLPCTLGAQTSAYQSADTNTSIFLANAKADLICNVSGVMFSAGYLHEGAGKSWLYGFQAMGTPSTNVSTLFQKGQIPSSAGASAAVGYHHPFSKDLFDQDANTRLRDDWALLQVTYSRSQFETAANSTAEPVKQTFDGYRALAAWDGLVNGPGATLLLGVAAGVDRENNLAQLKAATIVTPLATSMPGITPFTVQQTTSGYYGNYMQYLGAPIFTDAVFIPKKVPWLDLDAFTRSDAASVNRYLEGGVGVFVARTNNPTQVLGGISLAWKNGTPSIGVVAGWSF